MGHAAMERWKLNLYTIWFAQVISYISFGFGLPFLAFYIQDLGVTDPGEVRMYTGILNTVCGLASAVGTPIWGMLADRFGKKLMLLRAICCAMLIIAGMGMVTQVNQLILLRFAQGLFTGTVTAAAILVVAGTPNAHLTYALGLLSSSTFIGTSIGPVIGGLVAETVGYRNSFYLGALLMLANFFIVLLAVHDNPAAPGEEAAPRTGQRFRVREIITPPLLILATALLFLTVARSIFTPFLALYVQEIRSQIAGASGVTGMISGVVALMTALSGLILGRWADWFSKRKLLMVLLAAGAAVSLPLPLVANLWLFTAVFALLFLIIGGIEPIITAISSESASRSRQGAILGLLGFVSSLGFALAPLLGGWIAIRFSIPLILATIPLLLGLALVTLGMGRPKSKVANPFLEE